MSALADFWFCRIGGTIDKTVTPHLYEGGDITRINEVPRKWREEVREIIESVIARDAESDSEPSEPETEPDAQEDGEIQSESVTELESMTKTQLIEYANENGVDVSSSMTKADIISAIENAQQS